MIYLTVPHFLKRDSICSAVTSVGQFSQYTVALFIAYRSILLRSKGTLRLSLVLHLLSLSNLLDLTACIIDSTH